MSWESIIKLRFRDFKSEAYKKYDSQIELLNETISKLEDEVKTYVEGDAEKFEQFMDEINADLKKVSQKVIKKVNDVRTYDW
tara:strand:+ start:476 stop:721 length:246 start_codon:yes stop_codon:yes gene_type:complete